MLALLRERKCVVAALSDQGVRESVHDLIADGCFQFSIFYGFPVFQCKFTRLRLRLRVRLRLHVRLRLSLRLRLRLPVRGGSCA